MNSIDVVLIIIFFYDLLINAININIIPHMHNMLKLIMEDNNSTMPGNPEAG